MAFPPSTGPQLHQQPSTSDLWLRYPDNLGQFSQISFEHAINLLTQALDASQRVPFAFSYIDRPQDGQAYLVYLSSLNANALPPDGIRWLEQEKSLRIPAGHRELEVCEVKYGFVPGHEATASRARRRYRLVKGGNPHLMILHYFRAEQIAIPPQLMNAPIRAYPLRQVTESRIFVAGERTGQRVPVSGQSGQANGIGPVMGGAMSGVMGQPNPMLAGVNPMAMNTGLGLGIGAAQLAHQHRAIDAALAGSRSVGPMGPSYPPGGGLSGAASVSSSNIPVPKGPEDDDSADEYDPVTTRTLAIERFKRNHELMAEVFTAASRGVPLNSPSLLSPYTSVKFDELTYKVNELASEVQALKTQAEARRLEREAAAQQATEMENSAMIITS